MNSGIIRRVDDLGRIVIPKEIRRSLHVREGDPLEICIANNKIYLEPYRPMMELSGISRKPLKRFFAQFGCPIILCDSTAIIQAEGVYFTTGTAMHEKLCDCINDMREHLFTKEDDVIPIDHDEHFHACAVLPINSGVDRWGAVVLATNNGFIPTPDAVACGRYVAGAIADYLANS